MDTLSTLLRSFALRASVFFHSSYCGAWTLDTSGEHKATFHVIARGACWLHLPNKTEAIALQGGDLVVFPHDAQHVISSSLQFPGDQPAGQAVTPVSNDGPSTALICGYFEFDQSAWNPLLDALPEVIVIKGDEVSHTALMDSLIRFIVYETDSEQMGMGLVIDRLCDVLFIHIVRTCIKREQYQEGFLAALADVNLSKLLNFIHEQPEKTWTVQSMAKLAGMSRSAFAHRFHQLVGLTPIQYLTYWRMQHGYNLVTETKQSMLSIAEQCGYQSEIAFSKAFKRRYRKGPGAIRREARYKY